MEWRFSLKMEIKNILKIGLFVISTSIFFTACANKSIEKKVEKPKVKTINDVLNESFEYDVNQKLYKNKDVTENNTNDLLAKFEKFCSDKKGKLVYMDYYINQNYIRAYSNHKASVCEINSEPYFIAHQASEDSNIYYSVSMDEEVKKAYITYKNKIQLELAKFNRENAQNLIKERQEIQKREIAREQKTRILQTKKDEKNMTFFDSWRDSGNKKTCLNKCNDINLKSNGYKTLQDAIKNNWQLISKIGEIEEAIDDSCTCSGYSVLVKKLPTESK